MRAEADEARRSEDLDLVHRTLEGDESAYAELMGKHGDKIHGLAFRVTGNREDALEVAQDAFYKAYVSLRRFGGRSSFSTWLYTIAMNAARNKLRSRRSRGAHCTVSLDVDDEDGPGYDPPAAGPIPREEAQAQEAVQRYEEAVSRLGVPFREALLLRDGEGLSYEEIAKILGVSEGTVKSRINRAREGIRLRLISIGLLEE